MNKVYIKDGNSGKRNKKYCRTHFLHRYGREPNITDTATVGTCQDCRDGREVIPVMKEEG